MLNNHEVKIKGDRRNENKNKERESWQHATSSLIFFVTIHLSLFYFLICVVSRKSFHSKKFFQNLAKLIQLINILSPFQQHPVSQKMCSLIAKFLIKFSLISSLHAIMCIINKNHSTYSKCDNFSLAHHPCASSSLSLSAYTAAKLAMKKMGKLD
jgi:hypothetical protein